MKCGVVVFPGSNCDEDIRYVLAEVFNLETVWLWHKDTDLQNVDTIVIPGGFSYGDYLRSGAIARFSPIMNSIAKFAKDGGKLIGICNGFQILTEAGLLEGTLQPNLNQRFICKNTFITPVEDNFGYAESLTEPAYKIPIAHAEGRYFASDEMLSKLKVNNQILFKYSNNEGIIDDDSNINGSLENIAGICNTEGNVIGMMPHPERASEKLLNNNDGYSILKTLLKLNAE